MKRSKIELLCVFRPLGSENLLLRGATLKNTEYIYGNITRKTLIDFTVYQLFLELSTEFGPVITVVPCWLHMRDERKLWSGMNSDVLLCLPCSGRHLHRHGNQDGSQLPVQVSETLGSRKVSLLSLPSGSICFLLDIHLSFFFFLTNPSIHPCISSSLTD